MTPYEIQCIAQKVAKELKTGSSWMPIPTDLANVLSDKYDGVYMVQPLISTKNPSDYIQFQFEWNARATSLRLTIIVNGNVSQRLYWQ